MARQGLGAENGCGGVQHITEGDGSHRACELAGRLSRPVRKQHVLGRHMDGGGWQARMFLHQAGFVPDFGTFHYLDAVGAFFHDAAGGFCHCHFGYIGN